MNLAVEQFAILRPLWPCIKKKMAGDAGGWLGGWLVDDPVLGIPTLAPRVAPASLRQRQRKLAPDVQCVLRPDALREVPQPLRRVLGLGVGSLQDGIQIPPERRDQAVAVGVVPREGGEQGLVEEEEEAVDVGAVRVRVRSQGRARLLRQRGVEGGVEGREELRGRHPLPRAPPPRGHAQAQEGVHRVRHQQAVLQGVGVEGAAVDEVLQAQPPGVLPQRERGVRVRLRMQEPEAHLDGLWARRDGSRAGGGGGAGAGGAANGRGTAEGEGGGWQGCMKKVRDLRGGPRSG